MKRQITLALVLLVIMMTASALAEEEELIPFVGVYKVNLIEAPEGYSTAFNDPLEDYIYNNTEAIEQEYIELLDKTFVLDSPELLITLAITNGEVERVVVVAVHEKSEYPEALIFENSFANSIANILSDWQIDGLEGHYLVRYEYDMSQRSAESHRSSTESQERYRDGFLKLSINLKDEAGLWLKDWEFALEGLDLSCDEYSYRSNLISRGTYGYTIHADDGESFEGSLIITEDSVEDEILLDNGYTLVVSYRPVARIDYIEKPNIYLYPVEETEVSVSLDFAGEGYITTTIPDYGDGWTVTVTPDGLIDDEYDFLFYEGVVDAEAQYIHGWLIVQEELESFFRVNMRAYGFRGQEIEDFVEFWVPRLTDKPMYVICPQLNEDYDNLVALTVEPKPDTVLRLAYTIRGVDIFDGFLQAPELPSASFIVPQEREGFWVTEWGVLLTDEDFKQYIH